MKKKETKIKTRKYVRVAGYENRKPYGPRKNGTAELILSPKPGEIVEVSADDWQLDSLRTQASIFNMAAGYTRYSVSISRMLNKIYIRNNDIPKDNDDKRENP